MAVGPPLAGSSAAFAYGVCKDLFVYIKHKRKRVKDLVNDYVELRDEVDHLNARWDDIKAEIQCQSWFIQKNKQYTAAENKLSRFLINFEKIKKKFTMYCENLKIQNQTPLAAEASNGANVDQEITNAPASEFAELSDVGQQKIWTRKFFKLAQLDKDIVKLTPKISSFREKIRIEDLICKVKPKLVVKMESDELNNIVPSHEKHLADLKEYLYLENCKRIGIYGAPGVGKTNIMKNLNNCFDPSPPSDCKLELDYVIWVAVPGELTKEEMIENIQRKIIQRIIIDWQKYTSLNAADIISTELSKKKYLLLLDDFSSLIKLEEIGILEEHKDGKVVIAAKNPTALRNVKLDKSFEVNYLSLEDSRKLFNKFVEIDTLSEELRRMIGPILKQLGRLPGVIRSTAEYLNKDRDKRIWEGVKQRLQSDIGTSELLGLGGLEKAYRLFYEELEEISFKKCLLYAALFPNEHKIRKSTLVECWKAEQFLNCSLPTMDAARNEGAIVFTHLKRRYLLQSCCEEYVKMPGFFRKIALVLRFPGDGDGTSIARLGPEIDGHEREWKDARRVSLMRSKLRKLPLSPQCDRISTLLLQLNPYLEIIQDPFFSGMKTLRVLDLHRTGVRLLPPSISNLTALRCLYLNDCGKLTELPTEIGKLKDLEVLDIRGTLISCLPEEISSLISLSCLRISFAAETCNPNPEPKTWVLSNWLTASPKRRTWVIFPPGIFDKLHKLEELTIALGRTGISEEFRNRIQTEVRKSTKVLFIHPCIQRPFQSLDKENLIQSKEGANLLNPSLPENPGHDLMTEIQLPRSDEGPSCPQSGSTRGRTDSNYQASKKDKGKGIAIPKPKNKAIGVGKNKAICVGIKFREPETNERASGDDVDLPNSSAGASASGTTGRPD